MNKERRYISISSDFYVNFCQDSARKERVHRCVAAAQLAEREELKKATRELEKASS